MSSLGDTILTNLSVKFFITFLKAYPLQILGGIIVLRLLYNKFRPDLYSIPGPSSAPWTELWRVLDAALGDSHNVSIRLHKKHGHLVRTGPKHISVGDPAAVPIIYGTKSPFIKSAMYPLVCINWKAEKHLNMFSTRDPKYHRELRKKVGGAFSPSALTGIEDSINSCTNLLVEKLAKHASDSTPVDLGKWLHFYTFDIIGEVSFAKKLGFLEKGEDVNNIISTSAAVLTYIGVIGQVPYLNKLLLGNPLIPILYPAFELWDAVLIFTLEAINSCYSIVRDGELEAKEGQAVGKDMLSKWVAIKAGDPLKISTRDIVVTLSSSILAGSDSTAIVSKAILNLLLRHPEKMDKVLRELDAADAAGNFSNPISFKESQQHLPYFNAVMKESMRLHPPVGLMLERIVPPGGAEISGKYIPGGTVVGISPWVLQYNAEVFPNPSAFEPERWLDSSKEKLAEMERSFFAFGAGSRVCLGQHLAMLQLGKFLPQLLREFKISLTNPKKELVVRNNWFVQQSGFVCNLERRRK